MKQTLLFILAAIIFPFVIAAYIVYCALLALSLVIGVMMDMLDVGMNWVVNKITR